MVGSFLTTSDYISVTFLSHLTTLPLVRNAGSEFLLTYHLPHVLDGRVRRHQVIIRQLEIFLKPWCEDKGLFLVSRHTRMMKNTRIYSNNNWAINRGNYSSIWDLMHQQLGPKCCFWLVQAGYMRICMCHTPDGASAGQFPEHQA